MDIYTLLYIKEINIYKRDTTQGTLLNTVEWHIWEKNLVGRFICITDSLCTPKTNIILQINYTPIKFFK